MNPIGQGGHEKLPLAGSCLSYVKGLQAWFSTDNEHPTGRRAPHRKSVSRHPSLVGMLQNSEKTPVSVQAAAGLGDDEELNMESLVPGQAPSGYQTSQTSQLAEGNLLKGNQASASCTAACSHRQGGRPISRQHLSADAIMLVAGDAAATAGVLKVACSTQGSLPQLRRAGEAGEQVKSM